MEPSLSNSEVQTLTNTGNTNNVKNVVFQNVIEEDDDHLQELATRLNEQISVLPTAMKRVRFVLNRLLTMSNHNIAVTTSFGIHSAAMLHLISTAAKESSTTIPVIWIDTGYLPKETYDFADELKELLGLSLHAYQGLISPARMEAVHGRLWENPSAEAQKKYNDMRIVEPMTRAIKERKISIVMSELRIGHDKSRSNNQTMVHVHDRRLRICPIFDWTDDQLASYIEQHSLPYHPFHAKGYQWVGDAHSSRPFDPSGDESKREMGSSNDTIPEGLDSEARMDDDSVSNGLRASASVRSIESVQNDAQIRNANSGGSGGADDPDSKVSLSSASVDFITSVQSEEGDPQLPTISNSSGGRTEPNFDNPESKGSYSSATVKSIASAQTEEGNHPPATKSDSSGSGQSAGGDDPESKDPPSSASMESIASFNTDEIDPQLSTTSASGSGRTETNSNNLESKASYSSATVKSIASAQAEEGDHPLATKGESSGSEQGAGGDDPESKDPPSSASVKSIASFHTDEIDPQLSTTSNSSSGGQDTGGDDPKSNGSRPTATAETIASIQTEESEHSLPTTSTSSGSGRNGKSIGKGGIGDFESQSLRSIASFNSLASGRTEEGSLYLPSSISTVGDSFKPEGLKSSESLNSVTPSVVVASPSSPPRGGTIDNKGFVVFTKPACRRCRDAKDLLERLRKQLDQAKEGKKDQKKGAGQDDSTGSLESAVGSPPLPPSSSSFHVEELVVGKAIGRLELERRVGRRVEKVPQILWKGSHIGGYEDLVEWIRRGYPQFALQFALHDAHEEMVVKRTKARPSLPPSGNSGRTKSQFLGTLLALLDDA